MSGIALATVFAPTGWLGEQLARLGVQVAYTWVGVVVALTLIGLPFVVRSVQPALEEVDVEPRGGGRVARREPLDGIPPRDTADRLAGARDGLHAWRSPAPSASTAP